VFETTLYREGCVTVKQALWIIVDDLDEARSILKMVAPITVCSDINSQSSHLMKLFENTTSDDRLSRDGTKDREISNS
jgi:hypothetical protein